MYLYYSRKFDTYLAHAYRIIYHIQDKYMLECVGNKFICTQYYDKTPGQIGRRGGGDRGIMGRDER